MLRDTDGSSATEFALLFPMLFITVLGLIDVGWETVEAQAAHAAAQAGTDHVAMSGFDAAKVTAAVTGSSSLAGITATPAPTNTLTGCATVTGIGPCGTGQTPGTYAVINAQASFTSILNWSFARTSFTSTMTIRLY